MSLAEAAAFVAQAWPVFPCSRDKRPVVERGFYAASQDEAEVRAMFARPGAALIGVPMGRRSGLFLLDIDVRHGGDEWLQANAHRLPRTRTHRSMSGGWHFFFTWPDNRQIRNRASKWAAGVDIRGEGGYAIMPPSEGYSIEDDAMPCAAPGWLLDLIDPPAPPPRAAEPYTHRARLDGDGTPYGRAALRKACEAIANAADGAKHDTLNREAYSIGGLVSAGEIIESAARADLRAALDAIRGRCEDPRAAERTLEQAFRDGMNAPRDVPLSTTKKPQISAGLAPISPHPSTTPATGQSLGNSERLTDGGQPRTLPLLFLPDIHPSLDAADFVEGVLVDQSAAVIYGESNAGKTFFATDLALSVAAGLEWFGKAVDQGGVVYAVLEGGNGFRNRVRAWMDFNGKPDTIPFAAIPSSINLLDPKADTERLIDAIKAASAHFKIPVKLVVIDTLARAFAGGNENSSEDMGQLVLNMDRIRQETGAAVLFIHHSGKDQAKGARGHSSLRAAIDTEIEVKAPASEDEGPRTATIVKQRELPKGEVFAFALKTVILGKNRRQKPVTTCVITPADKPADTGPKMSDGAKKALSALDEVTGQSGQQPMSADIPKWARIVKLSDWRREFLRRSGESTEAAAERAFSRARKYLETSEKIGIRDGWVWRTDAKKPL